MAAALENLVAEELQARVRAEWLATTDRERERRHSPAWSEAIAAPSDAWSRLADAAWAWCLRAARNLLADARAGESATGAEPVGGDMIAALEPALSQTAEEILESFVNAALVDAICTSEPDIAERAKAILWERLQRAIEGCAEAFAHTAQGAGLDRADLVQVAWVHLFADEDQDDADPEVRRIGEARIRRYDSHYADEAGVRHFPRVETFVDKVVRRLFISETGRSQEPSARRRPGEETAPAPGSPAHQELAAEVLARIEGDAKLSLLRSATSLRQRIANQPPHVLQRALTDRRELRKLARPPERKEIGLGELSRGGKGDGDGESETERLDAEAARRRLREETTRREAEEFLDVLRLGLEHCRASGIDPRKLVAFEARWTQGMRFREIRDLPEVARSVGWIHRAVEEVQDRLAEFFEQYFPELASGGDLRRRAR